MEQAVAAGSERVTGFEANGGYLTASVLSLPVGACRLAHAGQLPAILVVLAQCAASRGKRCRSWWLGFPPSGGGQRAA